MNQASVSSTSSAPGRVSVDGLPRLCGREDEIREALERSRTTAPRFLPESRVDMSRLRSAAAVALHMHQPLLPAGGDDLRTAKIIGNLEHMGNHPNEGDNHNAPVFYQCYRRMAEVVPDLLRQGAEPRVMLEYSGTLLFALQGMHRGEAIEALRGLTLDPSTRRAVEWLGCPWGHAVAPSTPPQDFRMHVRAWQHHFAELFGMEALTRVRGFSPSEMALPNHPDVAYHFVKTLRDCGFRWLLVQEHTVEDPDTGTGPRKHVPHRLVCRSQTGDEVSIVAIVKTQGSDTKLVAQMQPYYEAKTLSRSDLGALSIPPLVTQIADGENGGVMMNEFVPKYRDVVREASGSDVSLLNISEYLEYLETVGVRESDLPTLQPIHQKRIWDRFVPGDGQVKLDAVIEEERRRDSRFHVEGGSWTNNISWVRGYEDVLGPMLHASALFHERLASRSGPNSVDDKSAQFNEALFLLLCSQTSCYRYWGQGAWTEYGREICRRAIERIASL